MSRTSFSLFTLNVGNTHTRALGWAGITAPRRWLWRTGQKQPPQFELFLRQQAVSDAPVIVSGVVPAYKKRLVDRLKKCSSVYSLCSDFSPGMEIMPKPAHKVGEDRIAAALGALSLDSSRPWVVVDVGTAITVNAVRPARGKNLPRFEGGLIVPGAAMSLAALAEHTAQLPSLLVSRDESSSGFIGRSTQEAMRLGVHHARIATVIELAHGQMRELGSNARACLTGGGADDPELAAAFKQAFGRKCILDRDLVHLGLRAAWDEHQRQHNGK